MPLAEEDVAFIKEHIREWLAEQGGPPAATAYEFDLRARIVRVEEEPKHQRELMREGFERMDQRFESIQEQMDKRFEQVDKRFEAMQEQMEKRFEQVDRRFESLEQRMDRFMRWSFGMTVTVGGLVVAAIKLLP
jgi:predicted nuclease with TOPRIM domain